MQGLAEEAPHGGSFSAAAYRDLFEALFIRGEVREAVAGASPDHDLGHAGGAGAGR